MVFGIFMIPGGFHSCGDSVFHECTLFVCNLQSLLSQVQTDKGCVEQLSVTSNQEVPVQWMGTYFEPRIV